MNEQDVRVTKGKTLRGKECSVDDFRRKYRLDEAEAQRLHARFGPSETELDLLMAAKGKLPVTQ